jgi:hypothetical protein
MKSYEASQQLHEKSKMSFWHSSEKLVLDFLPEAGYNEKSNEKKAL